MLQLCTLVHRHARYRATAPAVTIEGTTLDWRGFGLRVNRVANLLRDASRDLEHRTRMDGRRTGHARDRARQGDRPTHKAFEDARAAGDTDLYWDVQENTVVVVGPSNRVHFFGIDGRQVTSVVFPGNVIQQRVNQQRWARIDAEKRARFRRGIEPATGGGGGAAGPERGAKSDAPK